MNKKQTRFLTAGGLLCYGLICGYLVLNYPIKSYAWIDSLIKSAFIGIFLMINYFYLQWYEGVTKEDMK
jgi:hypothetical protein